MTFDEDKFVSSHNQFEDHDDDDDDQVQEGNQQPTQKNFEDFRIKLWCFGDCGSKIMQFLANQTNLKHFKTNSKTPRFEDIVIRRDYGRGKNEFYQKLKFISKESEDQFEKLFVNFIVSFANSVTMETN